MDSGNKNKRSTEEDCNQNEQSNISNILIFYVNGIEVIEKNVDPIWTLIYYLRNKLYLVGTKLGCAEGGCGACTVMISKYHRSSHKIIHISANACLVPVCALHGMAVTTIEGIGSTRTKLHSIQERIAKSHGSQCGFCTPGIVMSMYALLRSMPKPTMNDLEVTFQGNLCRCTGYRPIIDGFKTYTEEWEQSQRIAEINVNSSSEKVCSMGDSCCKKLFTSEPTEPLKSKFLPYDSTQEPIFPPKLQLTDKYDNEYLILKGKEITWYRPTCLKELLILKQQFPNARIIVGNTEVGIEMKFKNFIYPAVISPTQIKEMREVIELDNAIKIGASITLTEVDEIFRCQIKTKPEYKTRIFKVAVEILHYFAGKQIRNVAALGGNIMTGSPISDMNPVLMAADVTLNVCSLERGYRRIKMDHTFFIGYRRNIIAADEILVSIEIPYSISNQYFVAYKQAKRREDDIAIVNLALTVFFESGTNIIEKSLMAFGGMAPTTILARKTCEAMVGRKWNEEIVEFITNLLLEELPLSGDAPGGMILYRRALTLSLFFKGFVHIMKRLRNDVLDLEPLPKEFESAAEGFSYIPPKSSQYYQRIISNDNSTDLVGKSTIHASAFKQATGEAIYLDDMPKIVGELYMAFVLSTRAHAKLIKIDPTEALVMDGVVAFYDANDIPKERRFVGSIVHDDEVFVSERVTSQGQIIGAIVANDQLTAQRAAKMVKVEYDNLEPIIISIEDAIKANSFYESDKKIIVGDVDKAFTNSHHVLEGEVRIGGQEHFYLETHCSLAIPREEDELEIFCSTQHPSEIQKLVAHVLDVHINRINVRVKRIGGGFGGKESRSQLVALPVAFAAHRLRKPVRCMLDRDEDMMMSGTRHPFLHKYKVGFTNNGLINAIEIHIYSNVGYSLDLSTSVLDRAMFHFENSYKIPAVKVYGYLCKTNLPSNTAFRGFGGPQGMFAAEHIIRHIADYLGRDVIQISEMNLYKEGDVTHYQQKLENCTLRQCWTECLASANYKERIEKVEKFNREHRFRKRGFAVVPTKFGISFTTLFLNQSAALIHIYTDGSVLVSHGGVEMGQGLHTKMIQVASRILKVNPDKIHVSETAVDKVPNTSATAASAGSDLNGMAVMNACKEIMNRIQYIIDSDPNGTWEKWINKAYLDRVSLSATGFYKTPNIGYSMATNTGMVFNYFTYGTACAEVEIDCLTGDHQVLQIDIVMDLGESLNPAIDIGQVEGGFIQGYGLFTMEEMIYSPTGILFSRGPGTYKIPAFTDIPLEFNVSLLKGVSNPRAVFSSKAVGEPPLFLASSVFFAIKEAIKASRAEMNIHGYFRLDSPATAARIRMACIDPLIKKIENGDGKKAWNIVP
ncbi:PREDICTED: xanthine dehydrogenase [Ceratosolen solmsi marchali]|uniref:xanthine dehydrogenase n=1 Tax=Ceratosolen solmsi marchali TaxID=326594 RepID=A0AAJ6YE09_9HYME|nr:PREDICTED: xanthine dehydrogenase [Ceratosolen solmsi marchali]